MREGSDNRSDRLSVFRILKRAYEDNAFLNLELKNADDFVRAAVYGTVTYTYTSDFFIRHAGGRDPEKLDTDTLTLLRFGIWQILFSEKVPSYAACDSTVELAKKVHPGSVSLVNAILRKICELPEKDRNIENYRPEVAVSMKSEIFGLLKKSYGRERALSIGKAMLSPSPLTVRINPLLTDKRTLTAELISDGFEVSGAHFIEDALILRKKGNNPLDKTKAFISGKFFVQSESAMLASLVADVKKGDMVLDCCSAPGGKATHLAELSEDKAHILACDINLSRLELIKENAARLKLSSVITMHADAVTGLPEQQFDIVTCDVPCSGIGLLGKKPDIRLSLDYQGILSLRKLQTDILESACKRVKSGGTLIYSTCTLNSAENEDAVEAFLSSHDDFYAEDITSYLPSKLIMDGKRKEEAVKGYITLFPDIDGSDGFFICRMRRK